jgi:uncharacterized membrane protein
MSSAKTFFSTEQIKQIESAIQAAEENTSGEVCVHIENKCKGDVVECATNIFRKLKMHKTELRNGVMLFVAVRDKKFAVIGDAGIHKNVPEGFWDTVRDKMLEKFKQEKFTDGLCLGIEMTGRELKKYFPHLATDKNELSNEVTFGKK